MKAKNKTTNKIAKTKTANIEVPIGPKWCRERRCRRVNKIVAMPAIATQIAAACQESNEFKTFNISSVPYSVH
jgi:hypothetical protein